MTTLKKRVAQAWSDRKRFEQTQETERRQTNSKGLTRLLKNSLETEVESITIRDGRSITEIEGLTFTCYHRNEAYRLFLVAPCNDCGEMLDTEVRCLESLGKILESGPPHRKRDCPSKIPPALREKSAAEKLEALIKEIARGEL